MLSLLFSSDPTPAYASVIFFRIGNAELFDYQYEEKVADVQQMLALVLAQLSVPLCAFQ